MSFSTIRCAIKVRTIRHWRIELIVLYLEYPLDLCCDNCIRKKERHTHHFESIYDLISFLDISCGREPISRPVDDRKILTWDHLTLAKSWGNLRAGNHLTMRRRVLERLAVQLLEEGLSALFLGLLWASCPMLSFRHSLHPSKSRPLMT
jgi:hypothetical protein